MGKFRQLTLLDAYTTSVGMNYASSSIHFVSGSVGYRYMRHALYVRDVRADKIAVDIRSQEEQAPASSIFTRYMPLSFKRHGKRILVIPPSPYTTQSIKAYILTLNLQSRRLINVFTGTNKEFYHECEQHRRSLFASLEADKGKTDKDKAGKDTITLEDYVRLVACGGFSVEPKLMGNTQVLYKLRSIYQFQVNLIQDKNFHEYAVAYVHVANPQGGAIHLEDRQQLPQRPYLLSVTIIRIGRYPRNALVTTYLGGVEEAPRFIAIGFTKKDVRDLFGNQLEVLDKLLHEAGERGAESLKDARIRDLGTAAAIKVASSSKQAFAYYVDGVEVNLDRAHETFHFHREISITPILSTDITSLRLPEGIHEAYLGNLGPLKVYAVEKLQQIVTLVGFRIGASRYYLPPYNHLYISVPITETKALKFSMKYEDAVNLATSALLAAVATRTPSDTIPLNDRSIALLLGKALINRAMCYIQSQCRPGSAQVIAGGKVKSSPESGNYIDYHTIANMFTYMIRSITQPRRKKRKQRTTLEEIIDSIQKILTAIDESDVAEASRRLRELLGPSTLAWMGLLSIAYPLLKGLVAVLSREFLGASVVDFIELEGTEVSMYVVEANDYGIGFIDRVASDAKNILNNAREIACTTITSCNDSIARRYAEERLKALMQINSDVKMLAECIEEIRNFIRKEVGVDIAELPIDLVRVILYELLTSSSIEAIDQSGRCSSLASKLAQSTVLRQSLEAIYGKISRLCWDGCLLCVHISQRELVTGLTNHEQLLFVSKTIANAALCSKPFLPAGEESDKAE